MLIKLLKYDFKESGRLLLPILAGIILISIFGKLLLATNLYTSMPEIVQILAVIAYVMVIFVCCIGAPIYFIVFFYRDFYTNKGYIIHTLPVTTHQKLASKIISSFLLELLTFAVCILSILILLYEKNLFSYLNRGLQSANTQFKAMTGMDFYTFLILTLILLLISIISQLLMVFASISIGQLFATHRILGAIVGYLGLSFASQIINSVILVMIGFSGMNTMTMMASGRTIYALYGLSGCVSLLLCLAYYMISYFFMEKKLNLN